MTKRRGPNAFQYQPWTPDEDARLKDFAEQDLPWKEIAPLIPGRTVAACQTRWEGKFRGHTKTKKVRLSPPTKDTRFRADRFSDGAPIIEGHYVFRVPDGDPYLQQLIKVHGRDTINRDVVLRKVA